MLCQHIGIWRRKRKIIKRNKTSKGMLEMIKLMYITNEVEIAQIAQKYGVDRIWIDLEVNGKEERQKGMDTVKSKHEIKDIGKIKPFITSSELLVRVNPIYEKSKSEIEQVIEQGADIIMLPYFKTAEEVEKFIEYVDGRCKTMLLVETPEAVQNIDSILNLDGIDEVHIGLNDLHLGYKKKFMFELLTDGTVEYLCNKFKEYGIKSYGFGGISRIGSGELPAEDILTEHYRLGSTIAILSRSFCNTAKITDINEIEELFKTGVSDIRKKEEEIELYSQEKFEENQKEVEKIIKKIVSKTENSE